MNATGTDSKDHETREVWVKGIILDKKDYSGNPLVRICNDEIYVQPAFIVLGAPAAQKELSDALNAAIVTLENVPHQHLTSQCPICEKVKQWKGLLSHEK